MAGPDNSLGVDWGNFYASVGIVTKDPIGQPPVTRTVQTVPVTKAKATPVSYAQYFDPARLSNGSLGQLGVIQSKDVDWDAFYGTVGRPDWWNPAPMAPIAPAGGAKPVTGVQLPRPRPWDAPTEIDLKAIAAYEAAQRDSSKISGGSYTIQPGDTLSEIAARAGISVSELQRINGITNANQIWAGQTLNLAGASKPSLVSSVVNGVKNAVSAVISGGSSYKIQSGDTLSDIARRSGTTVEALAAANGISDPNKIVAGKSLVIPGKSSGGTTTKTTSSGGGSNSTPQSPNAVLKSNGDGTFTTSNSKQTVSVGQKVSTPSGVKTVQANGTLK